MRGTASIGELLNHNFYVGLVLVAGLCGVALAPSFFSVYSLLPGAVITVVVLVGVTLHGAYLKWRDGTSEASTSNEKRIAERLAQKTYSVGGQLIQGDDFFRSHAMKLFRSGISEQGLKYWLVQTAQENYKPQQGRDVSWDLDREPTIIANKILDDCVGLRLLDRERETKPGARPDEQGMYKSLHAMPQTYTVYSLSETGILVQDYLKGLVVLPSIRNAMVKQ